jgi:hypothetical protein
MSDSNKQELLALSSSNQNDGLNQLARDRYLLFYRRFCHLGPKKISKLYIVRTLDRLIKIRKDLEICQVYAITKMKNSISKTLANHMITKLALI